MATTESAYWQETKAKAAERIASVAEEDTPVSEQSVKDCLTKVLKHGTCGDVSECIVEAIEYMCSCHELKARATAG